MICTHRAENGKRVAAVMQLEIRVNYFFLHFRARPPFDKEIYPADHSAMALS